MTQSTSPFFRCKTDNAFRVKIVSEIASSILKTGFWSIGPEGISLTMMDEVRKVMIDIKLEAVNFQVYKFTGTTPIHIGINSQHFHKMLKSIKKKDTLEFSIDNPSSNEFVITTIPKDKTRTTHSAIRFQAVQNICIAKPSNYTKSVIIQSGDFQKMIKDLSMIGSDKIKERIEDGRLSFSADLDGIMNREVIFGDKDDDNTQPNHTAIFSTDQFERISKLSALDDTIHIYPCSDTLPIQIKTRIGSIGEMSVYIKTDEICTHEEDV